MRRTLTVVAVGLLGAGCHPYPPDVTPAAVGDGNPPPVAIAAPSVVSTQATAIPNGQTLDASATRSASLASSPLPVASASPPTRAASSPRPAPSATATPDAAPPSAPVFAGNGATGDVNGTPLQATFDGPAGLAFNQAGSLFVAEAVGARLRKVDATGAVTTFAAHGATFSQPCDLAFGPNGYLYVADPGAQAVFVVAPDGAAGVQVQTTDGSLQPRGIVADAKGRLFIADAASSRILEIDENGTLTTFAGSTPGFADGSATQAAFASPAGLALAADGTLYVADTGNHRLRKISLSGTVTTVAGSATAGEIDGDMATASFTAPSGLALRADGTLYVTEPDAGKVRRLAANGAVTTVATGLQQPERLAFDRAGRLFVACESGNVIATIARP